MLAGRKLDLVLNPDIQECVSGGVLRVSLDVRHPQCIECSWFLMAIHPHVIPCKAASRFTDQIEWFTCKHCMLMEYFCSYCEVRSFLRLSVCWVMDYVSEASKCLFHTMEVVSNSLTTR